MGYRIQFILTEEEYNGVKDKADNLGISVSQYCRDQVVPRKDDFKTVWDEFVKRLENYPEGAPFNVSQIFPPERWKSFDRSTKLSIARLFNKKVSGELIPNVISLGRNAYNVSEYMKPEQG